MSNKLANGDILPSCWIRRPSSSRPNQFYYYNTSTKEVQWKVPDSVNGNELKHTPIKGPPESPKGSRKSDGIGDQSKQSKYFKLFLDFIWVLWSNVVLSLQLKSENWRHQPRIGYSTWWYKSKMKSQHRRAYRNWIHDLEIQRQLRTAYRTWPDQSEK